MTRLFDIVFSLLGLLFFLPGLIYLAIIIVIDDFGPVLYRQKRVGKDGREFTLLKFRTMRRNADKSGLLTVGNADPRLTRVGASIRVNKLDELPQLINVLIGDMSFVGPRPEVPKYVELYTPEQRRVLSVRPGITDYASIEYSNENELLAKASDPEKMYIEQIMPAKIALNMRYIEHHTVGEYFRIILLTIKKIW